MLGGRYKAVGQLKPHFPYYFVSITIHKHSKNLFWFDLSPNDEQDFISIYLIKDKKNAVIETGPACAIDNLVEGIKQSGLKLSDIDYIIPTHIHLDHFGGGGNLMALCKNATSVLHPKAAKHVSDIDKWWEGSRDFLGEVAELYGKPVPIPKSRVISADEDFDINLGSKTLRALHTPGHAPHHVTWVMGDEAFVGDSLGLWYPELDKSFPVTPGYYRHDLAMDSIEKLSSLNLNYLHYTHFGPRKAAGAIEQIREEFTKWMEVISDNYHNVKSSEEILELLFESSLGLRYTDQKHGIHQRTTHLGSVEGMVNWKRRSNEKK